MAEISSLEIRLSASGAAEAARSIRKVTTALKNLSEKLPDITANLNNLNYEGLEKMSKSLKGISKLDLSGLTGLGKAMKTFDKLKSSDIAQKIKEIDDSLEQAFGGSSSSTASAGDGIEEKAKRFGAALKKNLTELGKIVKKISSPISSLLRAIGRIAIYRIIRAGIKMVTDGFNVGIQNVYQWSKAINGQFAKSMDMIASSANYVKNSVGAMVAPLINLFAPMFERLTEAAVNFFNILNQAFARFNNQDTWTRAIKTQKEYAQAINKTKGALAGFDEINNIGNKSNNKETDIGNYKFVDEVLDKEKADGYLKKLKDVLELVGLIGLGIKAWKLAQAVDSATMLGKALNFIAGLGLITVGFYLEFKGIKGIIEDGINGTNFAETLFGALGLAGGGTMLGKVFGKAAFGGGIGAIFGGGGMLFAGIYSAIKEGLNWLNGLLIPLGSTTMGAGIGAIIGSLGGPIGTGVGALIGLAVGALTDLIIYVTQNFDKIKTAVVTKFNEIKEKSSTKVGEIKDTVTQKYDAMKNRLIEIGDEMNEKWSTNWETIKSNASTKWATIKENFTTSMSNLKTEASTKWGEIKDVWDSKVEEIKTKTSTKFGEMRTNISTFMGNIKQSVSNGWSDIKTVWGQKWDEIKESTRSKAKSIINDYIIAPLNRMIDWLNSKLKFSYGGLRILGKQVIEPFSTTLAHINNIPQLATGTNYVPEDQLAMIHKGEAVVPKQFNSQEFFGGNNETNELLRQLIDVVVNKDMNTYIDGNEIGKTSVNYINKQSRIKGASII